MQAAPQPFQRKRNPPPKRGILCSEPAENVGDKIVLTVYDSVLNIAGVAHDGAREIAGAVVNACSHEITVNRDSIPQVVYGRGIGPKDILRLLRFHNHIALLQGNIVEETEVPRHKRGADRLLILGSISALIVASRSVNGDAPNVADRGRDGGDR